MLEVFAGYLDLKDTDELYCAAKHVLAQNLVHGDALTMLTNAGNPEDVNAMMERMADVKRNELASADLDYDRSELAARALRRMRAVLSPAQAQAAGLAER